LVFVVDQIARDLRSRYSKGFSRSNVFNFRRFYLKFPKIQPLAGFLSWSHIKGFSRSNVIYMRLFNLKYPKSQTLSDQLSWSRLFATKYRLSLPDKRLLQQAVERVIWRVKC
jgi:hypothetical protein